MSASAAVTHAAITGWGKCLPPAVLSNHDLSTLLDTSDEWIVSRTGIRERRIAHVGLEELAFVAAARALAAAGVGGECIELIVFGTCSHEDQVPNMASGIQLRIGAAHAAAFDINTACTSFLYGLSAATALIRSGVVRNALVIGAELISPFMDWSDRNVAVLFGDGAAAVVLEASARAALPAADVQLVVPHQANLRIIEAVARRLHLPMERVYVNIERYGNMSAATVPVALCEALEEGRVAPGALLLLPGFGGGLSYCAHLVRWGSRTTPLATSNAALPPNERSALEILHALHERKLTPAGAADANRSPWG